MCIRDRPYGGDKGGFIVASGTPEEIAACAESITGQYLKNYLPKPTVVKKKKAV